MALGDSFLKKTRRLGDLKVRYDIVIESLQENDSVLVSAGLDAVLVHSTSLEMSNRLATWAEKDPN